MQRLHERDYCGVCIEEEDDWDHLCLPARYEAAHPFPVKSSLGFVDPRAEGELLCEARYSAEDLAKLEIAMGGEYGSAGQFQQRPMLRGGGMFKRDRFQYIPASEVPAGGKRARGWDLAGSKGKSSAYTAGCLQRLNDGRLYIEHSLREKWGVQELAAHLRAQADADGDGVQQSYPQDPGSAGLFQAWSLAQALHGFDIHSDPESGDKQTRAAPLAGQVSARNVWLVRGEWNQSFIDEACSFPLGRYRDQIDAATRAYRALCDNAGGVDFGSASGLS
jgi:predicted phage terminase large subunit-like protein